MVSRPGLLDRRNRSAQIAAKYVLGLSPVTVVVGPYFVGRIESADRDLILGLSRIARERTPALASKGRAVPKLYSKLQANKELRQMLNIGAKERETSDVARLSGAELIEQLAD
jgi:hypothetical protein